MLSKETAGVYLGSHISGADIAPLLRDFLRTCDVEDTLRLVATVAAKQAAAGATGGGVALRGHQLALVVRLLLEAEAERQGRDMSLSPGDLTMCCDMAASVVSSPDTAFGVPVSDSAWSLTHRIAYQQFPDQEEQSYVPRSLALYRQIAPDLQDAAGFPFERAFEEAYGLSLDEVWRTGYALWQWCLENPGASFDGSGLARNVDLEGNAEAKVESFLSLMICDYASYRSLLGVPSGQQPHFEPYNLNPFRKYPVLKLPDGGHLVPIPGFLLRRITHGLYYDLTELDRPGFISLIGGSFKDYVGRLLNTGLSDAALLSGKGSWMVSDSDTVVLIECITRPFGALSRSTGDCAHLRSDLARRGGVVDCVKRLQGFIEEADGRSVIHENLTGRRVIGLVVALEDFYLANGPFIRRLVNDELETQGRPPMDAAIHLAHVSGLESLSALSLASDVALVDLMADKVDNADFWELELEAYARYLAASLPSGKGKKLTPAVLRETASVYLGRD